jgi:CSLREA domain-containing protein
MRKSNARCTLVAAVIIGFFGSFPAESSGQILRLFTVNTTSDTIVANACATAAPGCSLRGAITAASPNGEAVIQFAIPATDPFCSVGVCTINLHSLLPIIAHPSTFIVGPGADRLIVKPATGVNIPVFRVLSDFPAAISGLTISNGNSLSSLTGGGIHKDGQGLLELTDIVVRDNRGEGTAGVRVADGTVRIVRSAIFSNVGGVGTSGGGVGVDAPGSCSVINSTITGNTTVSLGGGGLFNTGGTINITNSTISGNSAVAAPNDPVFGHGGGIRSTGGIVNVKNSIIANNSATGIGPDVSGNVVSAGYNLIGKSDGSNGFTAPTDLKGTTASPLDPRLDPGGPKNNGGTTPTIAIMRDSPAVDKGTDSGLTGLLATDQRGTGFNRKRDNPLVPNASGGNGVDIGAFESSSSSAFDFDGDGRTDVGIFRPADASWWINRSTTGVTFAAQFGASTDRIVPADFTGDGKSDIATWRPATGQWFVLRSEDFSFYAFPFGTNGDIPVPADFDGDGKADPAVFRPSNFVWFILRSSGGTHIEQFGANNDVPVAGDYDGDGRADIAIYRPSSGTWWLNRSALGVVAVSFGNSSDKPVPGDFTGDGRSDVAIWRPSTGDWFVLRSEDFSFYAFPFGTNGDLPAPGDYDGDGRFDATVFRPSNSVWFSNRTTAGVLIQQFGSNGDRPVANAFVP